MFTPEHFKLALWFTQSLLTTSVSYVPSIPILLLTLVLLLLLPPPPHVIP